MTIRGKSKFVEPTSRKERSRLWSHELAELQAIRADPATRPATRRAAEYHLTRRTIHRKVEGSDFGGATALADEVGAWPIARQVSTYLDTTADATIREACRRALLEWL